MRIEITQEEEEKLERYAPSYLKGKRMTRAQVRQVLAEYFLGRKEEEERARAEASLQRASVQQRGGVGP